MIFGSVCSGIEAASVAWAPLGWRAAFVSEIDRFACAVLAHRWPDAPNFGNMLNFKEWPNATIDLLAGGTPCQSFSVAGLRAGLADPRGNLALTFLAVAARYRPRWLLWENVPGVRSSNKGRDFGAFLGALAELGYGFAWRSLDAQYFGVPQRRKRVFVVGHLGDWRRAAAVLFERHSLQGHPPPRREAGQGAAPTIASRPTGGGGLGTNFDCDGELIAPPRVPVAFDLRGREGGAMPEGPHDTANIRAASGGSSRSYIAFTAKDYGADACAVRRITPRECARLQGFPDDYLDIPYRGKPAKDGPKYKALGNSMAVPVIRWIGERIAAVEALGACACPPHALTSTPQPQEEPA